ncbi:MAG: acyl-CoA dehydrogenase family protein [Hyphomonadaceae bacterium]
MDFDDRPEEAAYRAEVRAFLQAHAAPREDTPLAFASRYNVDESTLARAKLWQRCRFDHGFAGITWPRDWGGQERDPICQIIFAEEEARFATPQGVYEIGLAMCVPTMMRFGRMGGKADLATRALRGDDIWCQLFSEPGAGSDVAALTLRADRDGEEWVLNGQKTWISVAKHAHYGLLLARSDRSAQKHAGLTAFMIDLRTPGIDVRPIRQITGYSHFNEVFFADARVPDLWRLGDIGAGWKVALSTLANERYATGEAPGPHVGDLIALATKYPDEAPAIQSESVRERLADLYTRAEGLRFARLRMITAIARGEAPGPEASIGKLVSSALLQDIVATGLDILGGADKAASPMHAWFQDAYLYAPATRIAGGTDEILLNIIAERVLGLPTDR